MYLVILFLITGCHISINVTINAKDNKRNKQSGIGNKMYINDTTRR